MKAFVWASLVLGIGATGCVAQTAERRFEDSFLVNGGVVREAFQRGEPLPYF